jgi:cytochrome c oxidase assembly protein subunit 15
MPPTSQREWEIEFDRYKQFPEWQQRKSMTLSDFKYIYFWEWGHRMMGRFLGITFAAPAAYFAVRGRIPRHLVPRLTLLFSMGGAQGLVGWWMVKSGLDNIDPATRKEIRVSPYRLATHLSMAFATYTLLVWTGLSQFTRRQQSHLKCFESLSAARPEARAFAQSLLRGAGVSGALVAVTVVSGAYVAGNDAGRAYNTWPKMGDDWIAPEALAMPLRPLYRNFVEDTALVQLDHRVLATATFAWVWAQYARAVRSAHWSSLPALSRGALHASAAVATAQVGLGISALLLYVPIPIAAAHQFGSLTLLTMLTTLGHSLRFSRPASVAAAVSTGLSKAATRTVKA